MIKNDMDDLICTLDIPATAGQIVWYIPPKHFTWLEHRVYECKVVSLSISQNKSGAWTKKIRFSALENGKTTTNTHDCNFEDIGTVIFLSEEEADAALKEDGYDEDRI